MSKQVFTTGEVARICQCGVQTVIKWVDRGLLRGYRIPLTKARRIPRGSLIAFLKDNGMPLGEVAEAEGEG